MKFAQMGVKNVEVSNLHISLDRMKRLPMMTIRTFSIAEIAAVLPREHRQLQEGIRGYEILRHSGNGKKG